MPPISSTLPERTAAAIRERVLALQPGFGPGERLYPGRLSKDLGVSVTPIREAFKILEVEGLVSISPRRGAVVANTSPAELREMQAVQAGLEYLAFDLMPDPAAITEADDLAALVAAADEALARGDIAACRNLSNAFHRGMVARSKNGQLQSLYDLLLRQAVIMEIYYPRQFSHVAVSIGEHHTIVGAMRSGRIGDVVEALRAHWAGTTGRLGNLFAATGPASRFTPSREQQTATRPRVRTG